jgi:thiamine biosynthesis lipoprotein
MGVAMPNSRFAERCLAVTVFFFAVAATRQADLFAHEAVANEPYRFGGTAMGMRYDCRISDAIDASRLQLLHQKAAEELERLESIFSLYRPQSELSKWNSSLSTEWATVPVEVIELLDFSRLLHRETDGLFDPTIGSLTKLWRIGSIDFDWSPPTESQIQAVKEYTGLHRIEWEVSPPRLRKKHSQVAIDLNSLVEGLALRNLSKLLAEHQIQNYLMHLGGEYLAKGEISANNPWVVYLEAPRHWVGGKVLGKLAFSIPLRHQSISTSGNYRTGKEFAGKRYSHFIHPRTGVALNEGPRCVSVVLDDPFAADGWASALMLLEPDEAIRLAEKQELAVCIFEGDGWLQSPKAVQNDCFQTISARQEEVEYVDSSFLEPKESDWKWLQFAWFACLSILLVAKMSGVIRIFRR